LLFVGFQEYNLVYCVWERASARLMPMVDPHMVFHWLISKGKLNTGKQQIRFFWRHFRRKEVDWAMGHCASEDDHPYAIYGDECVYNLQNEKLLCIAVSFVLHETRSSWTSHFPCIILRAGLSFGQRTVQPLLRRFAWSLNVAHHGIGPYHDELGVLFNPSNVEHKYAGEELANGEKMSLCEIDGDWKHHIESFGMKTTTSSNNICFKCSAVKLPNRFCFWNFGQDAPWYNTMRSTAAFIGQVLPVFSPCPLICVYGFHVGMFRWCMLHAGPLGLFLFINGAMLTILLDKLWFGTPQGGQEGMLKIAWDSFKRFCKDHNIRRHCSILVWWWCGGGVDLF
jgi:hypothetical protein